MRLPDGMWCYSGDTAIKANEELPYNRNGYITFGSFNNLAKVTPQVVELWANILKAVPNSKLLLKSSQPVSKDFMTGFYSVLTKLEVLPDASGLKAAKP